MTTRPDAPRHSRDRFTRSLTRICEELDNRAWVELDYDHTVAGCVRIQGRMQARALCVWAFGSWARGAPFCSDLDLAVWLENKWLEAPRINGQSNPDAPFSVLIPLRKLLGVRPLVHFVDVKDVGVGLAVQRSDLTLIWQHPDVEESSTWRDRIALEGR